MLASRIIGLVRILINDPDSVRWSDAELLGWLNDGQLQIVAVRPDAKAAKLDYVVTAGVEQTLPTGYTKLLDVIQNVGGRAVTLIQRQAMNDFDPDWYSADGDATKHFMYDAQAPKSFEVYPPAVAGNKLRILAAAIPTDCATTASPIDIDDIYQGPLVDWVCYRAWIKNTDSPADGAKAANAISTFMQALTGKTQSDGATQPARK